MTWLGFVGTTGMAAMDFRITDACIDWETSVEVLVRLADAVRVRRQRGRTPAVAEVGYARA